MSVHNRNGNSHNLVSLPSWCHNVCNGGRIVNYVSLLARFFFGENLNPPSILLCIDMKIVVVLNTISSMARAKTLRVFLISCHSDHVSRDAHKFPHPACVLLSSVHVRCKSCCAFHVPAKRIYVLPLRAHCK
jgi:hypothetical protein